MLTSSEKDTVMKALLSIEVLLPRVIYDIDNTINILASRQPGPEISDLVLGLMSTGYVLRRVQKQLISFLQNNEGE